MPEVLRSMMVNAARMACPTRPTMACLTGSHSVDWLSSALAGTDERAALAVRSSIYTRGIYYVLVDTMSSGVMENWDVFRETITRSANPMCVSLMHADGLFARTGCAVMALLDQPHPDSWAVSAFDCVLVAEKDEGSARATVDSIIHDTDYADIPVDGWPAPFVCLTSEVGPNKEKMMSDDGVEHINMFDRIMAQDTPAAPRARPARNVCPFPRTYLHSNMRPFMEAVMHFAFHDNTWFTRQSAPLSISIQGVMRVAAQRWISVLSQSTIVWGRYGINVERAPSTPHFSTADEPYAQWKFARDCGEWIANYMTHRLLSYHQDTHTRQEADVCRRTWVAACIVMSMRLHESYRVSRKAKAHRAAAMTVAHVTN